MKYVNGMRIIRDVLDSFEDYDQLPSNSSSIIERIIEDLKYERKIGKDTIKDYKDIFPELFEED